MKKKIIIIAAVLIIAVVAYFIYKNNKALKDEANSAKEAEQQALASAGNGYNGSSFNSEDDPQHKLTHKKTKYVSWADEIFGLFDGYTNADEELHVKRIILDCCFTDADWDELCICYGKDSSGMGLAQRCLDEDIDYQSINKAFQERGMSRRIAA